MNVLEVSIETPIVPCPIAHICLKNKYVTLGWVGLGKRDQAWQVGWVKNGHYWRDVFMQWPTPI